jgi:PAS domain S-box-containing protein
MVQGPGIEGIGKLTADQGEARRQALVDTVIRRAAGKVGEAFFRETAQALADMLEVRWVLFGQYEPGEEETARLVVFWDGELQENVRLPLRDSVWEHILRSGDCIFPDKLSNSFPNDSAIGEMGAQGCVGTQLKTAGGEIVGFVTVLDAKAIADPDLVSHALAALAGRACAELERIIDRSLNERLGKIVELAESEAYVFSGRTFRFEMVNRGARENIGYSYEELKGMYPWELKPEFSEERFREAVAPLLDGETGSLRFETRHLRKDGTTYDVNVRLQYFPAPDDVFFASINDITARKQAERRERFLINEINHRSKNLLSIVQAIAAQTVSGGSDDMPQRLSQRLAALAANQDVLVYNNWRHIPMEGLVRSQLGFVKPLLGARIALEGPRLDLQARAAQVLGMAVHELTTNALKHGSLSNDVGLVKIAWSLEREDPASDRRVFRFLWEESKGPRVIEPDAKGFGSAVIVDQPEYALGARVETRFEREGFVYRMSAAADEVLEGSDAGDGAP